MKDYEVCEGKTADELEMKVESKLKMGYSLHGSLVVVVDPMRGELRFFRAVYKL